MKDVVRLIGVSALMSFAIVYHFTYIFFIAYLIIYKESYFFAIILAFLGLTLGFFIIFTTLRLGQKYSPDWLK